MRHVSILSLVCGLALAAAPLAACCPDDECLKALGLWTPTAIKFPGNASAYHLRGDHLISVNDKDRVVIVDLKQGKSFDVGSAKGKRWHDGDIADGQVLVIAGDRLQAIALDTGKMVHDVAIGAGKVYGFGFAGKGQAFLQRGKTLDILELATGKTLHTIELGETDDIRRGWTPWQRVGNRLYIVGPATTLCVIDLDTGKLRDRFSIEARHGIAALHIEGSIAYCIGSSSEVFTWGRPLNHLTAFDMERKKSHHVGIDSGFRNFSRLGSGPYGTVYVTHENRVERFTMGGDRCGTFATPSNEPVLAVWRDRAIVAGKDQIRLLEIKETPVARK
jgi:hypothetical protein